MHGLRASSAEDQAVAEAVHSLVGSDLRDDELLLRVVPRHRLRRGYGEDEGVDGDDLHCVAIVASATARVGRLPRVVPCQTSVMSSHAKFILRARDCHETGT